MALTSMAPRVDLLAFLTLAAALGVGCTKPAPPAPDDAEVTRRAQAALAPLKQGLKAELGSAMAGSIDGAIDVCQRRAPELARAHSQNGVTVGRSAKKLRSPGNAPRPWLVPVMDRLAAAPSGSDAHEVVQLDGGRRGYAEAIWVSAPCLTCHGRDVPDSVAKKLAERYPSDGARGFAVGDFRGVFWAELEPTAR